MAADEVWPRNERVRLQQKLRRIDRECACAIEGSRLGEGGFYRRSAVISALISQREVAPNAGDVPVLEENEIVDDRGTRMTLEFSRAASLRSLSNFPP